MDKLIISGGCVWKVMYVFLVQKNSALPILAATLLADEP